jgi:hypothetical protein
MHQLAGTRHILVKTRTRTRTGERCAREPQSGIGLPSNVVRRARKHCDALPCPS